MLLEGLVTYTCWRGMCDEAIDAYYIQNPSTREQVEQIRKGVEKQIKPYLELTAIRYTLPIIMFAKDHRANIDLGNKKTLSVEVTDSVSIVYKINF